MNEQGQTNAARRWRGRRDTYRVTASALLTEVDHDKILTVEVVGADVTLTLASAATCIGCVIKGVVAQSERGRALVFTATNPAELTTVGCPTLAALTSFIRGQPARLLNIPEGSWFEAISTGLRWHVHVVVSKPVGIFDMGRMPIMNLRTIGSDPFSAVNIDFLNLRLLGFDERGMLCVAKNTQQTFPTGVPTPIAWNLDVVNNLHIQVGDIDNRPPARPADFFAKTTYVMQFTTRFTISWTVTREVPEGLFTTWLEASSTAHPLEGLRFGQADLASGVQRSNSTVTLALLRGDTFTIYGLSALGGDRLPVDTARPNWMTMTVTVL